MIANNNNFYCYYSDLPSPLAYMEDPLNVPVLSEESQLSAQDIDRIIEMAWEDRTPFDAITYQFGLRESEVRKLMKEHLRFSNYKKWRARVEACSTKHVASRSPEIARFRCSRQRVISRNRISKRK
jgi:uncharacterized protein (TIGR03643 family)